MAQAEFREVLPVDKDKLFNTIIRYEDYPKFVEGCTSVKVERKGPGQARVTFNISIVKDITYTVDLREDLERGLVEWSLVESDAFKRNNGRWQLKSAGAGKTDVEYRTEVDFKIPVPGFILNRIVKGSLPTMVKSFQTQAQRS